MTRNTYGVPPRAALDFGTPAAGVQQSRIEPFTTVLGVAGMAYLGPLGRFTVLPDRFGGKWSVYEAATVERKSSHATQQQATARAMKRAGIEV